MHNPALRTLGGLCGRRCFACAHTGLTAAAQTRYGKCEPCRNFVRMSMSRWVLDRLHPSCAPPAMRAIEAAADADGAVKSRRRIRAP